MNVNFTNQAFNQGFFPNYLFNNLFFNPNMFFLMNQNYLMNNNNHNLYHNSGINNTDEGENNNGEPYNIYETENEIYIENIYKIKVLKISRSSPIKFECFNNINAIPKIIQKKTKAYAIIGIISLYNINYLGYVSSSIEAATIFVAKIYQIISIELIKINNIDEPPNYHDLKENIKKYFSTKNLYYSNDYKISLPLSHFNQSIITNNKYLINYNFLEPFFKNNIPYYFYCQIIFGYVSDKNDIFIGDNNVNRELNMIIIERYINGNIIPTNDILVYIKQIEFITIFKNNNNANDRKYFSFVCYQSNESTENINSFYPFKMALREELNKFKKIICILKNNIVGYEINKVNLQKRMWEYNKSILNEKIEFFCYTSDWKKYYFENLKDLDLKLEFYSDNIIQKKTLWFIDINNNNFEHHKIFNSIKEIMWRSIKKQINNQLLGIDIGYLNSNNTNLIYNKFINFTDKYTNNFINKRSLLNTDRKIFQEVSDIFISIDNIISKINKNINEIVPNPENFNKIQLLCVTWNVGGSSLPQDYALLDLFTKNHFYFSGQSPDIVLISIQEIESKTKKDIYKIWTDRLNSSLNIIFPNQNYIVKFTSKIVGVYVILFVKNALSSEIIANDIKKNKKGKPDFGINDFLAIYFKYKDKIFSFASGHLKAGFENNHIRIETLKKILNKDIMVESNIINKFKYSDFWIILGDLNFSLKLFYKDAIELIQDKIYKDLYSMDQFYLEYENMENSFLKNNIKEGIISFAPTYKFVKNSDDYVYVNKSKLVPSYCDRIFYCKKNGIRLLSYERISNLLLSEHRPVTAAFEVLWEKKK